MLTIPAAPAAIDAYRLQRTSPLHFTELGEMPALDQGKKGGFEDAMLKAMDEVNALQQKSTQLNQRMIVDPESVDVHDVTIAMAEAQMSLNIAKTVINRVVTSWKELINAR